MGFAAWQTINGKSPLPPYVFNPQIINIFINLFHFFLERHSLGNFLQFRRASRR